MDDQIPKILPRAIGSESLERPKSTKDNHNTDLGGPIARSIPWDHLKKVGHTLKINAHARRAIEVAFSK